MNENMYNPDENWQPELPIEDVAEFLYDVVTRNARNLQELAVIPPEMENVIAALNEAGWTKNPEHEDNNDPHSDHAVYERTFIVNGGRYLCEAWVSETMLNLHQNDNYGVLGVVVSEVPDYDPIFELPYTIDTVNAIKAVINLATKELITYGVPVSWIENGELNDPDGSLTAANQALRKKFGLEEAEKRDKV